jgi:hypothetical protein
VTDAQKLQRYKDEICKIALAKKPRGSCRRPTPDGPLERGRTIMTATDFACRGFRYSVVGQHLEICRGHTRLARFDLCPRAAEPVRIGTFRREGNRAWATLEGGVDGRAVVEMKDGRVGYTVETAQKHFDQLTYFPASMLDGDLLHTFSCPRSGSRCPCPTPKILTASCRTCGS